MSSVSRASARRGISSFRTLLSTPTPQFDTKQVEALNHEQCILVDQQDQVLGAASKRVCHQVARDGSIPLHRAFSVFLFNSKGEMLMQKRGKKKVTFPGVYTNACCSHPLWLNNQQEDILTAAQRRLTFELGIPSHQMKEQDFTLLTKVHYFHAGDGAWGEHEIDYILFLQKDLDIVPNQDEVDQVLYISRNGLDQAVAKFDAPISPWFKLVLKHRLRFWWDNLHQLHLCQDNLVHHFK